MQSKHEINGIVRAIVSFTDSYVQNKQRKQKEQQESESTLSLDQVASGLDSIYGQILRQKSCKFVIRIPKLLQSLSTLSRFRLGTHLSEQTDLLRLNVRSLSRQCLRYIQRFGDEQVQSELVNNGYGRVMTLSFCTAGGIGEEQDGEIWEGLIRIHWFLEALRYGRNDDWQHFHPLPLLVRESLEQIEEEGAIEEIEEQMKNNGFDGHIKREAKDVKSETLNHFINRRRI
ncbi:MAG: hypothetical protein EZS28_045934 [Streblomastix strix]|uniref:Uncharacterized protein n=1 Tax=Streblomastix strix TaxID=222440 RepID=A0A5J4TKG9_9EUKA|nr:MAG: hypothetical protein EZS28_045934 [Streblomastix strix]